MTNFKPPAVGDWVNLIKDGHFPRNGEIVRVDGQEVVIILVEGTEVIAPQTILIPSPVRWEDWTVLREELATDPIVGSEMSEHTP